MPLQARHKHTIFGITAVFHPFTSETVQIVLVKRAETELRRPDLKNHNITG
jgi:hypothetical protein